MLVAIERKDGGVSILQTTNEANSVEEEVNKWCALHGDQYVSHRIITEKDLPSDKEARNSRDAWTVQGSKIVVDSSKIKIDDKKGG